MNRKQIIIVIYQYLFAEESRLEISYTESLKLLQNAGDMMSS